MSEETRHQSFRQGNGRVLQVEAFYLHDSDQHVVFWQDILDTFPGAVTILNGQVAVLRARDASFNFLMPRCIKYQPGKVLGVVLAGEITPRYPDSSASLTTEKDPPSRGLARKDIEEWTKTAAEGVSFDGISYTPTVCSEWHSTVDIAFTRLIVPAESEAGSLWSERLQDGRCDGRLSTEAADKKEAQNQQRIRDNSIESPQEVVPTPTSLTSEFAEIMREFADMVRAESGDNAAQELVGDRYMDGRIVPKDVQAAIDWYLRASHQRKTTAIERKLRAICYSNPGLTRECLTAVDRHRKTADQGDSTSQCNVGDLYSIVKDYGEATTWTWYVQDYAKAMTWFQKAAEQGFATTQNNIGYLFQQGHGVCQDYTEAMTWYQKAAEQGDAAAQNRIGRLYQEGYGVSQDYAKAMAWFQKAAEQGDAAAQNRIGYLYQQGHGVCQDYTEAMTWYRKAAEQGDAAAQNNIGYLYQQGHGVSQDYAKAMTWYQKAAEQGNAAAQSNIDYLYHQGLGVFQDC